MQRLFSTFPDGFPGGGLLLLRLAVGVPFVVTDVSALGALVSTEIWMNLIGIGTGVLLIVGLWTPVAGAFQAIIEGWLAFSGGRFDGEHVVRGAMGLCLIMLGPGAWSIDARLYGRKRLDL
jgi:putative oxidoreductase